ncbi:MAG TPA: SRPBCC domain-containing protein [Chitinophagaceae bacterium]|nr:SRPBCC domain-containing protein [Chitinophagaceae bacterium]
MNTGIITINKTFTAPAAAIWRAWTEPAMIKQWFGSDANGTVLSAQLNVQPGGNFEISFANADGAQHTCFGIYLLVQPYTKLSFTWTWKSEPGIESLVTVEIEPMGDFTVMHFTHAHVGFASAHNYRQGWADTFYKLERALGG